MATYKMIIRQEVGKAPITQDTCEEPSKEAAAKIFEERHGPAKIVAGPTKVSD